MKWWWSVRLVRARLEETQRHYVNQMKILSDSNFPIFWKRQTYGDGESIGGCKRLGKRKGWTGSTVTQLNHSVQYCSDGYMWCVPIEHTTPRVNPSADYGLWVLMMCQCRFIHSNKGTTLVWNIDREVIRVGTGGIGDSVLSSTFALNCEPKTALKYKGYYFCEWILSSCSHLTETNVINNLVKKKIAHRIKA